jgi:hypothetical protein
MDKVIESALQKVSEIKKQFKKWTAFSNQNIKQQLGETLLTPQRMNSVKIQIKIIMQQYR